MSVSELLTSRLVEIVDVARLAPSVHNTQPWKVSQHGDRIEVSIDDTVTLSDGDPTGRQTVMSLGIFAEALALAATTAGLGIDAVTYHDNKVSLQCSEKTPLGDTAKIDALRSRSTDRSIYKPVDLAADAIQSMERAGYGATSQTIVVTDQGQINKIANLTAKGIQLALSSPSFRKELSHYLVLPWSRKFRGISVRSLYIPWLIQMVEPWLMRFGIGLGAEVALEKKRWLSASGVAVITADGDMPPHWFEAGRSYLRVSLAIEQAGLSQATSAAIVEASDFHEDIEAMLGTHKRILSMIRIGKGVPVAKRKYSPRLPADALITSHQ